MQERCFLPAKSKVRKNELIWIIKHIKTINVESLNPMLMLFMKV